MCPQPLNDTLGHVIGCKASGVHGEIGRLLVHRPADLKHFGHGSGPVWYVNQRPGPVIGQPRENRCWRGRQIHDHACLPQGKDVFRSQNNTAAAGDDGPV
jgi:hypothetical protein